MSIKRILVPLHGGKGDAEALQSAAWLAAQHDAIALGIPLYPDAAADMVGLGQALGAEVSRDAVATLARAERSVQEALVEQARRAAHAADVVYGAGEDAPRLAVLPRAVRTAQALSRETPLCDLLVLSQEALVTAAVRDTLGQVLLGDRAAVLVVRGDPDRMSGSAMIAWDGSAQAGRAVRTALPLLAMASAVTILQCRSPVEAPVADAPTLNSYLDLHGIGRAKVTAIEAEDAGAALIGAAVTGGAGLFVAGAWGHSRVRETVFGGATRTFLSRRDGPSLLLAH